MNATTIIIPNGSSVIIENPLFHLIASLVIPVISIIAVIIVGVLSWQYSKKQHERSAMQYVFELLQQSGHKGAERNIRDKYKDKKLNEITDESDSSPASVIKRNYDQIGAMINSKLIPFEQYCVSFGILTIVSYVILKDMIEKERIDHKYHMAYFTNLAIDCFDFWNKQKGESKPKIDDPQKNIITKERLGKRIVLPKKRKLSPLLSRFCRQSR